MTMAETTFDWAVAQMERHTADGVVYTVHWTVTANDGTYKGLFSSRVKGLGSFGSSVPAPAAPPIRLMRRKEKKRKGPGRFQFKVPIDIL
jgi:hypothetical protein